MSYLPLAEHLSGITGLLEYNKITAKPIRDLTQILLRRNEAFWLGLTCVSIGESLKLPMYINAACMGYRLVDKRMRPACILR
ncbi:MAG TPA: hypothetical protein VLS85_06340 [Hanamia sp.]|nr:hypothetical protein [Hanamia sp.]